MPNKKTPNIETGKAGEDIAADYLREKGIQIIARNIRTKHGEIDILGKDGESLIFVEVKSRRSTQFGFPETAVDGRKQEHMVHSALAYLQENDAMDLPWRIDVLAINLDVSHSPQFRWFKNAVTG